MHGPKGHPVRDALKIQRHDAQEDHDEHDNTTEITTTAGNIAEASMEFDTTPATMLKTTTRTTMRARFRGVPAPSGR